MNASKTKWTRNEWVAKVASTVTENKETEKVAECVCMGDMVNRSYSSLGERSRTKRTGRVQPYENRLVGRRP